MNYAISMRHANESVPPKELVGGETKTLTVDSSIQNELTKEYTIPSILEKQSYFGEVKEVETDTKFHVMVEQVDANKDNLEKLLYMLEEKLVNLKWYEISLQVNHEDEGVKGSNSEWKVVRTKGIVPK